MYFNHTYIYIYAQYKIEVEDLFELMNIKNLQNGQLVQMLQKVELSNHECMIHDGKNARNMSETRRHSLLAWDLLWTKIIRSHIKQFCNTCFFPDVCGLPLLSLSNNTDPLADLEPNPLLSLSGGFCSQTQISLVQLHGNHEEWHLQNKRKIMHYPAVYNHSLHGRFNIFTSQCIPALYISEKRMQTFPCQ